METDRTASTTMRGSIARPSRASSKHGKAGGKGGKQCTKGARAERLGRVARWRPSKQPHGSANITVEDVDEGVTSKEAPRTTSTTSTSSTSSTSSSTSTSTSSSTAKVHPGTDTGKETVDTLPESSRGPMQRARRGHPSDQAAQAAQAPGTFLPATQATSGRSHQEQDGISQTPCPAAALPQAATSKATAHLATMAAHLRGEDAHARASMSNHHTHHHTHQHHHRVRPPLLRQPRSSHPVGANPRDFSPSMGNQQHSSMTTSTNSSTTTRLRQALAARDMYRQQQQQQQQRHQPQPIQHQPGAAHRGSEVAHRLRQALTQSQQSQPQRSHPPRELVNTIVHHVLRSLHEG